MTWKPPKVVTFGHARTRRVIVVKVDTLAEFQREYQRHFGATRDSPLPAAFWCTECPAIHLREDRRQSEGFRNDFLHELDHCYIDWRGTFYEP